MHNLASFQNDKVLRSENAKPAATAQKNCRISRGKKRPWLHHEDEELLILINQYGQSWSQISHIIGNRTGKQVRDRYLNYLRPDLKSEDFTEEEDHLLINLFLKLGKKWSLIARHMPGRGECQIKNHFQSIVRKNPSILQTEEFKSEISLGYVEDSSGFDYTNKKLKTEVIDMDQTVLIEEESYTRTDTIEHKYSSYNRKDEDYSSNADGCNENISGQCITTSIASDPGESEHFTIFERRINQTESIDEDMSQVKYYEAALGIMMQEVRSRETDQRYQELLRRKSALEFFYSKTIDEMIELERISQIKFDLYNL